MNGVAEPWIFFFLGSVSSYNKLFTPLYLPSDALCRIFVKSLISYRVEEHRIRLWGIPSKDLLGPPA